MSILSVVFAFLMLEVLLAKVHIQYAIGIIIILISLIPPLKIMNVGVNLNIFNISVLIFCLFFIVKYFIYKPVSLVKKQTNTFFMYVFYVIIFTLIPSLEIIGFADYIRTILLFLLEYLVVAICLNYIRFNNNDLNVLNYILVVVAFIVIVYGILNYFTTINLYIAYLSNIVDDVNLDMSNQFQMEERGFIQGRISSTFNHPLKLGQWAYLIFAYLYYALRGNINKVVYYVVLIGLILMIILCGSRSAIFPLCCFFIIDSYYSKTSMLLKRGIVVLVILGICYCSLSEKNRITVKALVCVWDETLQKKAGISGSSVSGRSEQTAEAFNIIKDNFWCGKGEGYVKLYGRNHPKMLGYESIAYKYLIDNGVIGLILFVVFYYLAGKRFLWVCKRKQEKKMLWSLIIPFFISAILTGITYGFFTLYLILCFLVYNRILNNNRINITC